MRRSLAVVVLVVGACAGAKHVHKPPAVGDAHAAPSAADVAAPAVTPADSAQHTHDTRTLATLSKGAMLLGELGRVHRTVSTQSPEAQAFFDQGLALTYGFNHDEAARSYARAAEIDPGCALCFWGVAYTLGPNYNIPMLPDRARAAWEALSAAEREASSATAVEQALIGALKQRYKGPEYVDPVAMQTYNLAYASAMRAVARQFPDDLDVQVLFAEAAMDTNPWKLWTLDGKPAGGTDEIVSVLESVLARDPEHAGANHYYIHAVEASRTPGRALPSADRLPSLVPGAGHLVHMPAHIYQRVGRYSDAAKANRRAIEVDRSYLSRVEVPGYYPFYLGHNYGFLAYADSMLGNSKESLEAARQAAASVPRDMVCGMPGMDFFLTEPLFVMVRFGRWDELLAEPAPDPKYPVLVALWHHGQGMALAAKGRLDEARQRSQAIRRIASDLPPDLRTDLNVGSDVLTLAAQIVDARIADAEHRSDAIALWQAAVTREDALAYAEPADWFYPVRHYLGAALLEAERPKEAEAVYRADLARHPDNGWSLFGLAQSLSAQKQNKAAKAAQQAYREAWKEADVELTKSAF